MAKKKKKSNQTTVLIVIVIVLVLVVAAALAVVYVKDIGGMKDKVDKLLSLVAEEVDENSQSGSNNSSQSGSQSGSNSSQNGGNGDQGKQNLSSDAGLSIHFLELGNAYAGDSVLLDCGDVEILIDAGSRAGSAATIKSYVDQYCTDGVLEYVIATHAHQDHIAGFVGTKAAPGIFETYKCETIIEFALTNSTSSVYKNYCATRDAEVADGAKCYTAAQCVKGENGAQKEYIIADGIKMTVLDNYYYYNKTSDENDYSVCVLIENGEQHYLFTGDLEKAGESKLVELNDLPHCELYKGGHHGSYTASNDVLLNAVTPDNICICCCAGSDEYTSIPDNMFPATASLERMVKHTTNIFVTTMYTGDDDDSDSFASFNGNIVVTFEEGKVKVEGSANSVPLPYTEWCKEHRPTCYKGD